MVETASIKGKIISFHNDSTSLCGIRRETLSEQTLLKIVNDPAQEVKSWKKGRVRGSLFREGHGDRGPGSQEIR